MRATTSFSLGLKNRMHGAWRTAKRVAPLGILSALGWSGLLPGSAQEASAADATVVFNELMYHPLQNDSSLEWIELHSQMALNMDVSGWRLAGGVEYTFPQGTVINGGAYIIIARLPQAVEAATGLTGVLGPFQGKLDNGGETLKLLDNSGREMAVLDYSDHAPWPAGADGSGFTLAKRDEALGGPQAADWTISAQLGGTPGAQNFATTVEATTTTDTLTIAADAIWKYSQKTDLGSGWTAAAFDDSAWSVGASPVKAGTVTIDDSVDYPDSLPLKDAITLENASFEEGPENAWPGYGLVNGWTATSTTNSGTNDVNGPFVNGLSIPDGQWVSFIQGAGSLSQTITGLTVGKSYQVDYYENERGMEGTVYAQPSVTLGGNTALAQHDLYRTQCFRHVISSPVMATLQLAKLSLTNAIGSGDNSVLYDAVKVRPAAPLVTGGNFEEPVVSGYLYGPSGFQWQVDYGTPIMGQGNSGFGNSPHEGNQAFIMQGPGRFSFTTSGFTIGQTYVLHWAEANRSGAGENDLRILIDDKELVPLHVVANNGWEDTRSPSFVATAASHKFSFETLASGGGDQTCFIDDVHLEVAPEPPAMPTSVTLGPVTTYFRKTFTFSGDPAWTNLVLNTNVDDGAVFYLNGQEIKRINMPSGTIGNGTLAATEIGNPAFSGIIQLPGDNLVQGTNVLAVEVHQASASSPDMLFDAELRLIESSSITQDGTPALVINELPLPTASPFWIELKNNSKAAIDLTGYQIATNADTPLAYTFGQGSIAAGAYLALDATTLGFTPVAGDKLFLFAPTKASVVDAASVPSDCARGRYPDGTGAWRAVATPTRGAVNQVTAQKDMVINEIMYHARPLPELKEETATTTILNFDATWKYNQAGALPAADWAQSAYNDSAWSSGKGLFYAETATLPAAKNTPLTLGKMTYYFRTSFTYNGDPAKNKVYLEHLVDDGAVFYLNGKEILRYNMADAPTAIGYDTAATGFTNDAAIVGPVELSSDDLVQGTNVIAVEVHQQTLGSSDVVFGARLTANQVTQPAQPYTELSHNFVELYNRGTASVSLSDWSFTSGIDYKFPAGATLAPGEYGVIAENAQWMRSQHPEIKVFGQYDGSLAHGGDHLVLKDANGDVADEVTYYDEGRWPSAADGGGSSLELTDPRTDNTKAAAWAASDESGGTGWHTYTYQGVASYPANTNYPPQLWHEFVCGLLEAGEFLLDDVSVIADPNGSPVEMMQNGSFDNGLNKWRVLGTHHATVEDNPDDPGNPVLHVRATGPTEHMSNHLETTFANGAAITIGQTYKITFRARWLSGSNQLNTRLYLNLLPRINLLQTPDEGGTPGRVNSRHADNTGPTYEGLANLPLIPAKKQPTLIRVKTQDPDGIGAMTIFWRTNGSSSWQQIAMAPNGSGDWYSGLIPGQSSATVVQFYIRGEDAKGASSFEPAGGPDSRALFTVQDGRSANATHHTMRVLMLNEDSQSMYSVTDIMANEWRPCTVIYDERQPWYDARVRPKGAGYSRAGAASGYHLYYGPDTPFRGVHKSVAIDIGAGQYGLGASQAELLVKLIYAHAGQIPGMYDDVVSIISENGVRDRLGQLMMGRYSNESLDSMLEDGADGILYKYELIYYSTTSVDGGAESYKLSPAYNAVVPTGVDLNDLGNNQEDYRWYFLSENQRQRDDYDRIMTMAKTFALTGTPLLTTARQRIDVDEWMRLFAAEALCGVVDTLNYSLPHNLMFYVRPADRKVMILPWDNDICFYTGIDLFGTSPAINNLLAMPTYRRLFLGHMVDIMESTYNLDYLTPWINHYHDMTDFDLGGQLSSYITDRIATVNAVLPAKVDFALTTNNGANFSVAANSYDFVGNGWLNVRKIYLSGRTEPLELDWNTLTQWKAHVPLQAGVNVLEFQAYDFHDNLIGTQTITVTNTLTASPIANLRISELMAAPAGTDDDDNDEFIEFHNVAASSSIDLSGVKVGGGVNYTFPSGTTLAAGAYLVLTLNPEPDVFRMHHGLASSVAVLGPWTGKLNNGGDTVTVAEFDGGPVRITFTYTDQRGWPVAAGKTGHSLVPLASAQTNELSGSLVYGGNWRASARVDGSPGQADPEPAPGLVINELMANTSLSDSAYPGYDSNDWVELYNAGSTTISTANYYLSDDPEYLAKWALPVGSIAPGGRLCFDEVTGFNTPLGSGFGLSQNGEALYLSYLPGTSENRVIDAVGYLAQRADLSLSRCPDGGAWWQATAPTRNQANGDPVISLCLNEIMLQPASTMIGLDNTSNEYLEIINASAQTLTLASAAGPWRLAGGVTYTFPAGFTLPPYGTALLVSFDPTNTTARTQFLTHYGLSDIGITLLGPWSGHLTNTGDILELEAPQLSGDASGELAWNLIDEAITFNQTPWPSGANGSGLSLQRSQWTTSGNEPANWAALTPTPGRFNPGQTTAAGGDWMVYQ